MELIFQCNDVKKYTKIIQHLFELFRCLVTDHLQHFSCSHHLQNVGFDQKQFNQSSRLRGNPGFKFPDKSTT